MYQTRTLYSPVLVFYFVTALLRLALASNTFIVYAHRMSVVICPEVLEMQIINPSKRQRRPKQIQKSMLHLDADEND